jgi:hypothetical protein
MEVDGRPQKKPTSPWVWVGCGCGVIVLLGLAVIVAMTFWVKDVAETMTDPEKRAEKIQEVLPYDKLPEGYYPAFAFSAPFGFMEMAVLSDHDPTSEPITSEPVTTDGGPEMTTDGVAEGRRDRHPDVDFDQRGFIYFSMRQLKDNKTKMRRFLRGEAQAPEDAPWVQSNVEFDPKQVVRRGSVRAGGREILFSTSRGEISRQGRDREGLVTMVMPECSDKRFRFGLWFTPDPDPGKPVDQVDWTGTGADSAAIQQFLGHFKLCGA